MRTSDTHSPPWIAVFVAIAIVLGIKALFIWVLVPIGVERGLLPAGGAVRDMYYDIAVNLAAGDGYRVVPTEGETMMRGPGYVYFLAGLIRLFGSSLTAPIIANLVLSAGTMGVVIMLTRKITSSFLLGVMSAVVFGLHPGVMFMDARLNVETFFTFFLCVFVLLLYSALEKDRLRDYVVAGLALGFVSLSRSSPFFELPFLFLYLMFVHWGSRPFVRAAQLTAVTGITAMLVLSPWIARNYLISGKPTFSESHVGIGAFMGQYTTRAMGQGKTYADRVHEAGALQKDIAAREGVAFRPWTERNPNWDVFPTIQDELRYNEVLLAKAVDYYKEDWTLLPRHCLYNSFRFWFIGTTPKVTMVGSVVQVPLMLLALIGTMIGFRQGLRILPMLLVMFTIFVVHIPLISHARYSTPLVPFLVILASIAVARTPLPAWARRRWGVDRIEDVGGQAVRHPATAVQAGRGYGAIPFSVGGCQSV